MKLGASVLDVISLLPGLRPYQTCVDVGWEDWEDQVSSQPASQPYTQAALQQRRGPAITPHLTHTNSCLASNPTIPLPKCPLASLLPQMHRTTSHRSGLKVGVWRHARP